MVPSFYNYFVFIEKTRFFYENRNIQTECGDYYPTIYLVR